MQAKDFLEQGFMIDRKNLFVATSVVHNLDIILANRAQATQNVKYMIKNKFQAPDILTNKLSK